MKKIIGYSIIIFAFSIGIGFYYSRIWKIENMSQLEENEVKNSVITETAAVEEKISYNATLALKKYYNECGHCKVSNAELPIELVNMTEKELENLYSDWRIEKFSSENVVLAQNIDSFCDEHYVLKLGENNIEIYKIKEYDDFELFKETGISKEYLTQNDINSLEEGIFVFGIGDLNSALEDFE